MMAGFKTGEVSKKETAPANGARLFISPTNTGIVEHEQNGVTNPIQAPSARRLYRIGDAVLLVFHDPGICGTDEKPSTIRGSCFLFTDFTGFESGHHHFDGGLLRS